MECLKWTIEIKCNLIKIIIISVVVIAVVVGGVKAVLFKEYKPQKICLKLPYPC